jgi:hypothetical protein
VQRVQQVPLRQVQVLQVLQVLEPQQLAWGQEWARRVQRERQQRVQEPLLQAPLQLALLHLQEQASCLLLRARCVACALREAQWLTMVP